MTVNKRIFHNMRSVRLGRVFDCVLVHDAISHMTSRTDLAGAIKGKK